MIDRPRRTSGLGTAAIVVAVYLVLFHFLGAETWGHGRETFARMLGMVAVLGAAPWLLRVEARIGSANLLAIVAFAATAGMVVRHVEAAVAYVRTPSHARIGLDIGRNVDAACTHFLAGHNPYAHRAQLQHTVEAGPHVVVADGVTTMYGLRYRYGFPYFPAMFLAYLPFRSLAPALHAIRVGNLVFLLLGAACASLLAYRGVARPSRWLAAGLVGVAYFGIPVLTQEHVDFAVTDVLLSTLGIAAYLSASFRRPILTGILLGLAQSAKLLPGPWLALPAALAFERPRDRWIVLGSYAATALAVVLPALAVDPESFVASTVAFYLTHHRDGDDSSLSWFLPAWGRSLFVVAAYGLGSAAALRGLRRRHPNVIDAATDAWLAYFVFTAFNKMTHLNYLWGIHAFGAVAFACVAFERRALGAPRPPSATRDAPSG